jgi:photosystem II stability/assembly factor-like uncharacterized protein
MFRFRFRFCAFFVPALIILSTAPASASIVDLEPVCHHPMTISGLQVHEEVIFTVQASGTRLVSYDASDPFDLIPLDTLDIGGPYTGPILDESGGQLWAYFNSDSFPLTVDVTDPGAMAIRHPWTDALQIIKVEAPYAYGLDADGFAVFDVLDASNPHKIAGVAFGLWTLTNGPAISSTRFYWSGEREICYKDSYEYPVIGIDWVDVSVPTSPVRHGFNYCCTWDYLGPPCVVYSPLIAADNWMLGGDIRGDFEVYHFGTAIAALDQPTPQKHRENLPSSAGAFDGKTYFFLRGSYNTSYLHAYDVSDPENPYALTVEPLSGRYIAFDVWNHTIYAWRADQLSILEIVECPPLGEADWTKRATGTFLPLYAVSFADTSTGVAVGENGTIVRTSDGGQTWTPVSSGTAEHLVGVEFSSPLDATAVGYAGTILRTTDGGATWTPRTSGTGETLWDVSFADASTGTVVGFGGTVLRTTDGGDTWTPQSSGVTARLFGVDFTDALTGTAVGNGGRILRTTDGGAAWTSQTSGTLVQLRHVSFVDAFTGTVVGEDGTILSTDDGGANWVPQTSVATSWLGGVTHAGAGTGLAVGDDGVILRTADGGITWRCESGGVQTDINAVTFVDEKTAIAVGDGGVALRWEEGTATPVLITGFYARPVDDGIELIWRLVTDEGIDAIRVYRSTAGVDSEILLTPHALPGTARAYTDLTATAGIRYRYAIVVTGRHSGEVRSATVEAERAPLAARLYQNRPNPFNPTTVIRFDVPTGGAHVSLRVYDVRGNLVRTLVDGVEAPGERRVVWNGRNEAGNLVATGVYFYRMTAPGFEMTRKMVLLQ